MDPRQFPLQPGWGPPPAPYPLYPPRRPGGATAIAAAVLSFLGSIAHAVVCALCVASIVLGYHLNFKVVSFFALLAVASLAAAVALSAGAVMLLRRRPGGGVTIVATCAAAIPVDFALFVLAELIHRANRHYYGQVVPMAAIGVVLTVVVGGLTIILAMAPPTKRWCRATQPSAPPPPPMATAW
ncbi:hypothetical protein MFM001_11770 [Mycobacterium sp. MFM001]|uniref:hypothetical protein n=1 Tax=Mycobacterium sp. MFM001 TaxID=2049453 RepID=UPI000DA4C5C6|nr:hypothetical protein [Mycobacterium sp. MFM001]GBE64715.1 hypothetical protein MFM001_11770 [Mycobacterium sp. MFM001]